MKSFLKRINYKSLIKCLLLLGTIIGIGLASYAFADTPKPIAIKDVQTQVAHTVSSLANILVDFSLVAGIGFVMASFFKFHQHKLNPTQVSISQGATLLCIGALLMLIPALVPLAATSILGQNAANAQLNGTAVQGLIGTPTS